MGTSQGGPADRGGGGGGGGLVQPPPSVPLSRQSQKQIACFSPSPSPTVRGGADLSLGGETDGARRRHCARPPPPPPKGDRGWMPKLMAPKGGHERRRREGKKDILRHLPQGVRRERVSSALQRDNLLPRRRGLFFDPFAPSTFQILRFGAVYKWGRYAWNVQPEAPTKIDIGIPPPLFPSPDISFSLLP